MKRLFLSALCALVMFSCSTPQQQQPDTTTEIIPVPQHMLVIGEDSPNYGGFVIDKSVCLVVPDADNQFNATYLQERLCRCFGHPFSICSEMPESPSIVLELVDRVDAEKIGLKDSPESYVLQVSPDMIHIAGLTTAGVFYGIQSLMQLLPAEIYGTHNVLLSTTTIPSLVIQDYPRFAYRGLMLDCSRTFYEVSFVKSLIDWLSYHKINNLHWHLADDQGWRIEIKKYPRLTEVGAWRGEHEALKPAYGSGMQRNGGFYTQEEIKDIVRYASERNIRIIPEIDLPGHSKAVAVSYPEIICPIEGRHLSVQFESNNVWCVGREENYQMIDDIIGEMVSLFPSQLYHIGADEVNKDAWSECPICQEKMRQENMKRPIELQGYFVRRVEAILNKYGKSMGGWDEILDGGELLPSSTVYAWQSLDRGLASAQRQQPTVMQVANYMYYDMKQSADERGLKWAGIVPLEKAYEFDPTATLDLTEEQMPYIIGVQAGLWTECGQYPDNYAEYQLFPKVAALAEIGWSPREKRQYDAFKHRLEALHFSRMQQMGIRFRIAPPIVVYEDGKISASKSFDNLEIRYSDDRTEPTMTSALYTEPIVTESPKDYRFAAFLGTRSSISRGAQNIDLYDYIFPAAEVVTNIPSNNDVKCLADGDLWTYYQSSRPLQDGDYIEFHFTEPVSCSKISAGSGYYTLTVYGVPNGYIAYSYNGVDFERGGDFIHDDREGYIAICTPQKPVRAVRINVTGIGETETGVFQDLRIEQ